MQKKVLVLGVGQNNFLSFLYGALKKTYPEFSISVPIYKEVKKNVAVSDWMYDNGRLKKNISLISYIKAVFIMMLSKHHYETLFFILFFEKKLLKSFHFVLSSIKEKAFFIQNENFKDIDTFHFHYMQYSYLRELFVIDKNKKVVCSFWGSDLLRTSDTLNHYFVKKALNRANIITCQSMEMKEIILSKFGRELYDKIQINNFPIDESVFNGIDCFSREDDSVQLFKEKHGFSKDKINVLIGHNGNPQNNHLKCIAALSDFDQKEKLHLIVNLCYGLSQNEYEDYKNNLEKALKKSGFSYVILEKFFTGDELVFSRLATDVFIHVPVSDALSATLTEMMYAGCISITGAWLPYNTLRQIKLYYHEINDFNELAVKLNSVVSNKIEEEKRSIANKPLIRAFFFRKEIVEKWAEILS